VKVLLDTHTLLWYVAGDPQLSKTAESMILNTANDVFMSPASYWEIAIKVGIGKLVLNQPFSAFIDVCVKHYGFLILPIEPLHADAVSRLPFFSGHRDPFDRMLVVQAIVAGMGLISVDRRLDAYGVRRFW